MAKKTTERDMYNRIKEIVKEDAELFAFCEKKLSQLDKKHSSKKVDEEKVAQDKIFVEKIREVLANAGHKLSIAEIKKADTDLMVLSSSKMSYLLRTMEDVVNSHDKKVSYFELVQE